MNLEVHFDNDFLYNSQMIGLAYSEAFNLGFRPNNFNDFLW